MASFICGTFFPVTDGFGKSGCTFTGGAGSQGQPQTMSHHEVLCLGSLYLMQRKDRQLGGGGERGVGGAGYLKLN